MGRCWLFIIFSMIAFRVNAQISEDFTSGGLDGWVQSSSDHWEIVDDGTNKVLHQYFNSSVPDKDAITRLIPSIPYDEGMLRWRFRLRHGYDPSGSNYWTFILCSDTNSVGIVNAVKSKSIMVGVNLNASDDLLKVWEQSVSATGSRTITSLATTDLNWQTKVTKASYGYVEVTRDYQGNWDVKFSETSFEDCSSLTKFTYTEELPFSNLGLLYVYTASADLFLWCDDISLTYTETNPTNKDSELSVLPIGDTVLTSSNKYVELLRMNITDKGTNDGKSTIIKGLTFNVDSDTTDLFSNYDLYVNSSKIPTQIALVDNILKIVPSTAIEVPDGSYKQLSIYATSSSTMIDGAQYEFKLVSKDSIQTGVGSSLLGGLSGSSSRKIKFDVIGANIQALTSPSFVVRGANFDLALEVVDIVGNLDENFAEDCKLTLVGDGNEKNIITRPFTGGIASFTSVLPLGSRYFELQAEASGLEPYRTKVYLLNDTTSVLENVRRDTLTITRSCSMERNAVSVASFELVDAGTDGLPTRIKSVQLALQPSNTSVEKLVGGVVVQEGEQNLPCRISSVENNVFSVELSAGGITVADGSRKPVNVQLYFKPEALDDNQVKTVSITGVGLDSTGSLLGRVLPIAAGSLKLSVTVDTLYFSKFSSTVTPGQNFSVDVKALDYDGNLDVDVAEACRLTFAGAETKTVSATFVKGVAKFDGVQLSKSGRYTVTASFGGFTTQRVMLVADADSYLKRTSEQLEIPEQKFTSGYFDTLRFLVVDTGTSDTLATRITDLQLTTLNLTESALAYRTIDSVRVYLNGNYTAHKSLSTSGGRVTLKFEEPYLNIPNQSTSEVLVQVKLRKDSYQEPFLVGCSADGMKTAESSSIVSSILSYSIKSDTIKLVNPVDADSEVEVAVLADTTLLISGKRVELLRMVVTDRGTNDAKPTRIDEMAFNITAVSGANLFSQYELWMDGKMVAVNLRSTDTTLIVIPKSAIDIADGSESAISLFAVSLDTLEDGAFYKLSLNSISDIRQGLGSSLVGSLKGSSSRTVTFNVVAQRMEAVTPPKTVVRESNFGLILRATDATGSVDKDYADSCNLAIIGDDGSVDRLSTSFTGGIASFTSVLPLGSRYFELQAEASGLESYRTKVYLLNDTTSVLENVRRDTLTVTRSCSTERSAVSVASFELVDAGTDGLPTRIKSVQLALQLSNTSVEKLVAGVVVQEGEQNLPCRVSSVENNVFWVELSDGGITVADGSRKPVNVQLYFKPGALDDNQIKTVSITGVDLDSTGSLLGRVLPIAAGSLKLSVTVDTLSFSKFSSTVTPGQNFLVDVKALDYDGNLDVDVAEACRLTFDGAETKTVSASFVKGVAKFDGVQLPKSGRYTVTASFGGFTTQRIMLVADADSYLKRTSEQLEIPEQKSTSGYFDALRFLVVDTGTSDTLATRITDLQLTTLGLGENALAYRTIDSVRVYLNGSYTAHKSMSTSGGRITLKFEEPYLNISNQSTSEVLVQVKLRKDSYQEPFLIGCSADGLKTAESSSMLSSVLSNNIKSDTIVLNQGIGKLISSGYFSTKGKAHVSLKKTLNEDDEVDVYLFSELGATVPITELAIDDISFEFTISEKPSIVYGLKVLIRRGSDEFVDSISIRQKGGLEYGDVAISEIMSDPTPSVGLPELEYLEIYNRTVDTIDVAGWSITVNSKQWKLSKGLLMPNGYLAIASSSGAAVLAEYGDCIPATYFDGLPNASADITIKNWNGTTITGTYYTEVIFINAGSDGGRSMEKVDVNSDAEEPENWCVSKDEKGGTPGKPNSVQDKVVDNTAPQIAKMNVTNGSTLMLEFNESVRIAEDAAAWVDGNRVAISINHSAKSTRLVVVSFDVIFSSDKANVVRLSGITDVAGNIFTEELYVMYCTPPQKGDLAINEVLFNSDAICSDYVEVVNISGRPIDISTLLLIKKGTSTDEVKRLSVDQRILKADDFLLICSTPDAIAARYPVCDASKFITVTSMPNFANSSGTVAVADTLYNIIDQFSYTEGMHHKMLPTVIGVSLERIHPKRDVWYSASKEVAYGTPGKANSQEVTDNEAKERFTLVSDNISPDGNGYNDYLAINYKMEEAGSVVSVDVLSSAGRLVKRLYRNEMIGVDGTLVWDGTTDDGSHAPRGIYVVVINVAHQSGKVEEVRRAFSVSYR